MRSGLGSAPCELEVGRGSSAVTSPPTDVDRRRRLPAPTSQDILGYTWPGIEYGEPPSCAYTFFEVSSASQEAHAPCSPLALTPTASPRLAPPLLLQYIDALRLGDLARFRRLEAACQGWYTPSLDRGAGAALHCAVDHGRLEAVKYLVGAAAGRGGVVE